jgi:4,5-DOPA dioxygenase extradiol
MLFVSHGAPTLALTPGRAGPLLRALGERLAGARAIVMASAHWETSVATASLAARPETLYDFRGFPTELYSLRYDAPGAPEVAVEVIRRLDAVGIQTATHPSRGLDHGAWVPLRYLVPDASIPVTQLSIVRGGSPQLHLRIGQALRGLQESGVVVIGSGSLTHNLGEIDWAGDDAPARAWAVEFADWFAVRSASGDVEALLDYRRLAPHAVRNHPTEEHLLPYFVALGSMPEGTPLIRQPAGVSYGVLAMDAFAPNRALSRQEIS